VSLTNTTNANSEFQFSFEVLAAYGLSISCLVTLAGTTAMKEASTTVLLSAPSYSASVVLSTSFN
jgi:hypothetical protein